MKARRPGRLKRTGRYHGDADRMGMHCDIPIPRHVSELPREWRRSAEWLRRVADWWDRLADDQEAKGGGR